MIELDEMTRIVEAIYQLLGGSEVVSPGDSPQERAREIFARMDTNKDGSLNDVEFVNGCLQDGHLAKMMVQKVWQRIEF